VEKIYHPEWLKEIYGEPSCFASQPFCSHRSPCQKTTNTSVHAMRIRPFARIKQAEETPTRLPILFFEWTTKILRNSWNNYILAQAKHRWSCTRKSLELEGMAVSGTVTSYNPHKAIKLRGLGRNTDCNKWNLIGSLLCIWVFYLLLELWSLQISCLATSWYILLKLANLTFSACTGPASTSWGPVTTLVGIVLRCLIFYDAVSLQNASSGMSRQQLHTSPRCKCIPQGMWCAVL